MLLTCCESRDAPALFFRLYPPASLRRTAAGPATCGEKPAWLPRDESCTPASRSDRCPALNDRAPAIADASGPGVATLLEQGNFMGKVLKLVRSPVVAGSEQGVQVAQASLRRARGCVRPCFHLHFDESKGASRPDHERLHKHVPFWRHIRGIYSSIKLNRN